MKPLTSSLLVVASGILTILSYSRVHQYTSVPTDIPGSILSYQEAGTILGSVECDRWYKAPANCEPFLAPCVCIQAPIGAYDCMYSPFSHGPCERELTFQASSCGMGSLFGERTLSNCNKSHYHEYVCSQNAGCDNGSGGGDPTLCIESQSVQKDCNLQYIYDVTVSGC